ncbi:uncharacterized protein HD556DRAFT_1438735 [Suillus plorans]|uniref:Myb/SANT-like domain-containing protein n=2 Tax=Suillus plorans TaxID=116603 RepID=A0A9P7DQI8_9AGAM|nr:uncharacterized protein HD556DRAFT_1438735 [Suillus plorans]KAG1800736.1 hypothetical protein HD556DRAFT_1438735 [Suillus plorans]
MAQPEVTQQTDSSKAHWQDAEVEVLLHHLIENRASGGDGGNVSMPTYNSAAAAINTDGTIQTIGPPKTGKMVKTKWTSLKKTFNQIEVYRNVSGFHWDNVRGAGIEGTAAASVWDTYVAAKSRIAMRPLRNKGWPPYDDMQAILGENSGARGRHAFHPATTAPASISIDDVLDDADGGLNLLDMDVDPSVPDMSADLMMPLSIRASATTGSQSSKRLRTNTLLDSVETSSLPSSGVPISTHPATPQSSTLPLSTTLVPSTQVFKKARVSAHGSTHMGTSSAARVAAKITPAAAVMNMQGSINRLTDAIEKSLAHPLEMVPPPPPPPPPPPAPPTMISRGLAIMRSTDADLGVEQRATLLRIFTRAGGENNLAAYVELEDDFEMRRAFISGLLVST